MLIEHDATPLFLFEVDQIYNLVFYSGVKRCTETLFFNYSKQYGTNIKVARSIPMDHAYSPLTGAPSLISLFRP